MDIRANSVSLKDITDKYKDLGKDTVNAVQKALKDNTITSQEISEIENAAKSDGNVTVGEKLLISALKSQNEKVIKNISLIESSDNEIRKNPDKFNNTENIKASENLSKVTELSEKFTNLNSLQKQQLINSFKLLQKAQTPADIQKSLSGLPPDLKESFVKAFSVNNASDLKNVCTDKTFKKMPDFLQSLNALNKSEQATTIKLMKKLNNQSPAPNFRTEIRQTIGNIDKSRSMEIGKTLNKVNVFIPPMNPNAPTAEDASTRMKTMYMGYYGSGTKAQADYVRDCLLTASKENFKLSVQVSNDTDKNSLIKNISNDLKNTEGLSDKEVKSIINNNLKIVITENDGYVWAEDNKFITENGKVKTLPDLPGGDAIEIAKAFSMGYVPSKNSANYAKEGIHSAGLPENDPNNLVEEDAFQGAVNERQENQSAEMLGKALKKDVIYTRTYNEGGNMLPGTLPNGDSYAVIGRDGLLISTFKLEEDYKKNPKSVPEFDKIPQKVSEMEKRGAFTKELINETITKLKASDELPKGQNPEQKAKEFLAKMEITEKEIFPKDIGIDSKNIIFVAQPDFHVDMHMRPLAPGTVMINDFDENIKLLQAAKSKATKGSWEEKEINKMIDNSQKMKTVMQPVMSQIEKQLASNGIKVVKAPGVMESDSKKVNFMNAVPGTSTGTNKQYYMTNYTSIKPLRDAFEEYMKKNNDIDKVYWIGNSNGSETTLSGSETSLKSLGGMDCRENHEGY